MFKFLKLKKSQSAKNLPESSNDNLKNLPENTAITSEGSTTEVPSPPPQYLSADPIPPTKDSWLGRLKQGLNRTREKFTNRLATVFLGKKTIDKELLDDIENVLLTADVGITTTEQIITELTQRIQRKQVADPQALYQHLQELLQKILLPLAQPLTITHTPHCILMVGVNGSGKTTTIGKLAKYLQQQGHKPLLAAGDTFRAAAIEQLQVWGERNQIPVIRQENGADSAAVVYDGMAAATARGYNVVLADTAGRLHTQIPLMSELKKVARAIKKLDPAAPHHILLVLDASIGQNALTQARQFHQELNISGICLTKLDGTAKGGIIFAIANELHLPIYFIGVGEKIDDLQPFDAKQFVEALFMTKTDVENDSV